MKNDREFRLFKPLRWIAPSILVGAGICNVAAAQQAQAEPIALQLSQNLQSQNLQPPRRGPAVREVLSYEMKGDELTICNQQGNSEQKRDVVGTGSTARLR